MIGGTLISATVETMRVLKDGSVSINIETPELSPAKVGEIFELRNKVAFVYFSTREITDNERKMVDSLDPELKGKTPGQRLRAVLFIAWQQSPDGYKDSESYYRAKMESIVNGIKAELT